MRKPDLLIGDPTDPYLRRWHVLPWNTKFNVYLHNILKDDDDRALHDHPYAWNLSIILWGGYYEIVTIKGGDPAKESDHRTVWRGAGSFIFRKGPAPHRLVIPPHQDAWTLFVTGPRVREWGFYCPKGWRPWHEFATKENGVSQMSKGCE